jgi:glucosamine--fructose-6-phosphate aminotransferase (isomerizing)
MSQTLMATEIAEVGAVVRRQLAANAALTAKAAADLRAREPAFVATVARGSSDHATLYLKHLVELKLGLACASLGPSIASLYHAPLKLEGAVAVAISQSGQSPDIVAMQRTAKAQRAMTIALVNDEASPLAQEADALLPLCAGAERSVAATKSMIAALVASASLVAHWGDDDELRAALTKLPSVLDSSSAAGPATEAIETLAQASSLFVVGRGATRAIAAEAALKLKETSAIHAEAFSSAEVLHGPAGIIGPGFPVLAFAPADAARPGFFDTLDRLAQFGATPLLVDIEPHKRWPTMLALDGGHPLLTPIVALHAFFVSGGNEGKGYSTRAINECAALSVRWSAAQT